MPFLCDGFFYISLIIVTFFFFPFSPQSLDMSPPPLFARKSGAVGFGLGVFVLFLLWFVFGSFNLTSLAAQRPFLPRG